MTEIIETKFRFISQGNEAPFLHYILFSNHFYPTFLIEFDHKFYKNSLKNLILKPKHTHTHTIPWDMKKKSHIKGISRNILYVRLHRRRSCANSWTGICLFNAVRHYSDAPRYVTVVDCVRNRGKVYIYSTVCSDRGWFEMCVHQHKCSIFFFISTSKNPRFSFRCLSLQFYIWWYGLVNIFFAPSFSLSSILGDKNSPTLSHMPSLQKWIRVDVFFSKPANVKNIFSIFKYFYLSIFNTFFFLSFNF